MPKAKKFVMGLLQQEWVRALKSGDFLQARQILFRYNGPGQPYSNCCLGVALCVLEANGVPLKYSLDANKSLHVRFDGSGATVNMPTGTWEQLKLNDADGGLRGDENHSSLIRMNDTLGWSLEQIGEYIEQHPENVFTGPA